MSSPFRLSRRQLLVAGGLTLGTSALAACGGGSSSTGETSSIVKVGSYQSDEIPKQAFADMMAAFEGGDVEINTIQHETFKEGINNYLQGNPDDVFTWFAGYRARYFAERGLVGDLSDVWANIDGMPESMKVASTSGDGKQVFIPSTYYPWAVFYRPSLFQERGYTEPTTIDEWITLNERMLADGLTPIGFADKDGWEAMGTFDMLNLRVNGYDYHVSLMAGEEAWDGDKVKNVFKLWSDLMPYHEADSLGRTWQEAAQGLIQNRTGVYVMGMFVQQQFAAAGLEDDLDFFIFPEADPAIGAKVVEAPVDGFMMAADPKNPELAKELLAYLATPEAVAHTVKADPSVIAANSKADQSSYNALQKKAVKVIEEAEAISQFLDRDSRPDFANTVVGPALQSFIQDPSQIDSILSNVEEQKKSIFASE
ncbi:ABC transporter substrate-binding protein [Tessaracoccus flavus]|uniref:Sugar ABC transporter substrate-binding protein n=1 Tax=Tessaracoccus flavus TaxID=1610493 RepID=A0A1Q2CBV2_9ACTN|nr:ABC transporter substrate-binding protein [Tessaracoccus flavus]AQP43582.1 sugar ABC transporter substrate-binding protein [Tessaracoccus flavus]SDY87788.1 carbohydrate ABC transporter substrate-binding protein, CUT1 family [Tessaracoccus flavus]